MTTALLLVDLQNDYFEDEELHARRDVVGLGVGHLVLAGVSTESWIAATATDAYAHDLEVTLVEDATASVDPELHDQTLRRLHEQYRQSVRRADDISFEPAAGAAARP